jgi:hypothetical protein
MTDRQTDRDKTFQENCINSEQNRNEGQRNEKGQKGSVDDFNKAGGLPVLRVFMIK